MPRVSKDPRFPKGPFYCSYVLSGGKRAFRSTQTKSKSEATIICAAWDQAEREAESGSLSESRAAEIINETLKRIGQSAVVRVRLVDWFEEWLESKTSISPNLKKRYRFAATKFLEFLGEGAERRLLESITEADVRRFAASLKADGRCGATINRIVRIDLGNAFNRAMNLGKIKFSPVAGVEPEKDTGKLPRETFTPEQIVKLIETVRGTDWEGAIRFGYSAGPRLQDVASLRWDAIDLSVGVVVFVQKKTGQQTVVAIHPDFESWLLRNISDDPKAFVFPGLANKRSDGRSGLSAQFSEIVLRSGIDAGLIREKKGEKGKNRRNLTFHALRHGAASSVFNAAIVKETARRITGHAERGALDRYVHLDLSAIKNASTLIPRLPL
jgi:integrase